MRCCICLVRGAVFGGQDWLLVTFLESGSADLAFLVPKPTMHTTLTFDFYLSLRYAHSRVSTHYTCAAAPSLRRRPLFSASSSATRFFASLNSSAFVSSQVLTPTATPST